MTMTSLAKSSLFMSMFCGGFAPAKSRSMTSKPQNSRSENLFSDFFTQKVFSDLLQIKIHGNSSVSRLGKR